MSFRKEERESGQALVRRVVATDVPQLPLATTATIMAPSTSFRTTTMWRLSALLCCLCLAPPAASFTVVHRSAILATTPPQQQQPSSPSFALFSSSPEKETESSNKLPPLLDPGTKGGALFYMTALFAIPYSAYQILTQAMGMDPVQTGITIGAGFTVLSTVAWMSTYLFRVATKDMTYAKQLKDYENAVIAKRLEELEEDEVQALVDEVEKDNF